VPVTLNPGGLGHLIAPVTVTFTSDAGLDLGAGVGAAFSKTFNLGDPLNFNLAISAPNDHIAEGLRFGAIDVAVTSTDTAFNGLDVAPLLVEIADPPADTAPVAADDSYSVHDNHTLTVAAAGVVSNDTDADGDPLTAVLVTGPGHGSLTLNANGSFSYTPTTGFVGTDTFTYQANDGTLNSNTATVTINVTDTAPVAVNDSYSVNHDHGLGVAAPGVLGNDNDAEGDPLTALLVSGVSHGSLTLNANGSFSYTPTAGFVGADTFTYQANDGALSSNTATVTINVNETAPVAVNDSYSTNLDQALPVAAPGVLSNDTDAEGDALSASLVSGPSHGNLAFNSNGSFSYTPFLAFVGYDSFTYYANDGLQNSNSATANITVNDGPNSLDFSTGPNSALNWTINLSGHPETSFNSKTGTRQRHHGIRQQHRHRQQRWRYPGRRCGQRHPQGRNRERRPCRRQWNKHDDRGRREQHVCFRARIVPGYGRRLPPGQ
jgi:VCBS repeat-containing protein